MAQKKQDSKETPDATEGIREEALPVSQADNSADEVSYAENPDKPDPTTIAQVEVGTGSDS